MIFRLESQARSYPMPVATANTSFSKGEITWTDFQFGSRTLVAGFISPDTSKPPKIAIVDFDSGEILNTYDLPNEVVWHGDGGHKLEWMKDGRSILYEARKDEVPTLWAQPVGAKGAPVVRPQ